MAAEPEQPLAGAEDTPSKKKKWIIIGGAAALVLIVIVLLALLIFGGDDTQSSDSASNQGETSEPVEVGAAYYVAMPKDFIFNVPGERRDRVVQITVQLLVRGSRNETLAQQHIPILEGTLLQVFSSATGARLRTPEGKREIRLQALDAAREAMRDATNGSPVIEEVLFTGFVIQ
ncbi:flagellar basal body-associated protein FliL [Aliidiomarina sp. Khilg15.8]